MSTSDERYPDISTYFQQAATLRLCLQYNLDDYDFSQRGGRIVYLMDTNIVRFFLNPQVEIGHVSAFGKTRAARETYGPATAALTAEFLFSRRLAGQQESPAFITPSHGEDVLDVINGLRRSEKLAETPGADVSPKTLIHLNLLLERAAAGSMKPDAAAAELRKLVPSIASLLLEGDVSEVTHLQRLYEEDLLRPLALYPGATREIMELNGETQNRVRDWKAKIVLERPAATSAIRRKIDRDAEALVQIMLLDEQTIQDPLIRFVLITADQRLFDAYTKWFWSAEGPKNQDRFLLRLPLQYVPLLNILEMPNGIESSDIIKRARLALDSLFVNLRRTDPGYPHTLSLHRILARMGADFHNYLIQAYGFNPLTLGQDSVDLFRQTRRDWEKIYENCVVLNYELIESRTKANLVRLSTILRNNTDLRISIYEDQQRILDQVAGRHIAVGNRINLSFLTGNTAAEDYLQRAPLALRVKFPRVLGAESLNVALDRLAKGDRTLREKVDFALNEILDYEAFFFAACVAHRCASWWASWFFACRAIEAAPASWAKSVERYELIYLLVSATRYALPTREAIESAIDKLAEMEEHSRKKNDLFGLGRALCEKTSFVLIALYSANLVPGPITEALSERVKQFVPQFLENIEEAAGLLQATKMDDIDSGAAIETLRVQLFANIVSADVLGRVLRDKVAAGYMLPTPSQVDEALPQLKRALGSALCPAIVSAECLMILYDRKLISPMEARAELSILINRVEQSGYKLHLDEVEFARYSDILNQAISN